MDPFVVTLLSFLAGSAAVGGMVYFIRVRMLSMGTKKEIITALSVMGVSGIVLLLLTIFA